MNVFNYKSPLGFIRIDDDGSAVTGISFCNALDVKSDVITDINKEAAKELSEYFSGKRKRFDVPIKTDGTAFQKKVWSALCTVPYGTTATYKDIAKQIGDINACRAVGNANHNNPVAIMIPCHRIISSKGALGGYACGADIKKALLMLEGVNL